MKYHTTSFYETYPKEYADALCEMTDKEIILSGEDYDRFIKALKEPAEPTQALKDLMKSV